MCLVFGPLVYLNGVLSPEIPAFPVVAVFLAGPGAHWFMLIAKIFIIILVTDVIYFDVLVCVPLPFRIVPAFFTRRSPFTHQIFNTTPSPTLKKV